MLNAFHSGETVVGGGGGGAVNLFFSSPGLSFLRQSRLSSF